MSATLEHPEGVYVGDPSLLGVQVTAAAATIAYSGVISWGLQKLTDLAVGLRVTREQEREGLDIALHGEQVF